MARIWACRTMRCCHKSLGFALRGSEDGDEVEMVLYI